MLGGPTNILLSKITHAQGKAKPKEWYQAPVRIVCKTIYNYTKLKHDPGLYPLRPFANLDKFWGFWLSGQFQSGQNWPKLGVQLFYLSGHLKAIMEGHIHIQTWGLMVQRYLCGQEFNICLMFMSCQWAFSLNTGCCKFLISHLVLYLYTIFASFFFSQEISNDESDHGVIKHQCSIVHCCTTFRVHAWLSILLCRLGNLLSYPQCRFSVCFPCLWRLPNLAP